MPLVSKPFGDIVTFTRASTATFTGSNGLIQSAAIDAPRFDYDPVTLAAKGLLIEEQRTNLCLYSAGVGGTGWNTTISGAGVTPVATTNFAVAPDGTTTASRIQFSLGGGTTTTDQSLVTQALTGTSCRGSFYIKTNDGSSKTVYVRGLNAVSITVDGTWRRYDFDAGTLSTTQFGIGLRGGQSPTNDNTADLLIWGAQLEAGSFATSYIPTVASQVTRSADLASVNTLSPWYNATQSTVYAEIQSIWTSGSTGGDRQAWSAVGGTDVRLGMVRGSGGSIQFHDETAYRTMPNGTYDNGSIRKVAIALADPATLANAAINGTSGTVTTDGTTLDGRINSFKIGTNATGGTVWCGWIRRFTYYPRQLTLAECAAITA